MCVVHAAAHEDICTLAENPAETARQKVSKIINGRIPRLPARHEISALKIDGGPI
jgi:hypothetical protein